jgi:hypothetical protein
MPIFRQRQESKDGLRLPWQCHCCGKSAKSAAGLPIPVPAPTCSVCGQVTCDPCVDKWASLKRGVGARVCKDCAAESKI